MTQLLMVIGRPASGKTSLAKAVLQLLKTIRPGLSACWISDYGYFAQVFSSRDLKDRKFQETPDGGYLVLDRGVFDGGTEYLASKLERLRKKFSVIMVEFARGRYAPSLKSFERAGLKPDLVVFVQASLEECLARNSRRSKQLDAEEHYVSRQEMMTTYQDDDLDMLRVDLGNHLVVFENEPRDLKRVREFASNLVERIRNLPPAQ